jgi:NhaP-type Na+/H+ or K+/H+ antiporter
METFFSDMPQDFYSLLVMAVVAIVAIWLAMFVVRKLIGFALMAALIVGGILVWQDPAILQTVQEAAVTHYHDWRDGASAGEDGARW